MATKHDGAWTKLRINQEVLNAAQDVAAYAIGKKVEYWEKAVKFLVDLQHQQYVDLSQKQTNWARSIRMDLEQDHGYRF